MTGEPSGRAAIPVTTKMPDPIIAPTLIAVTSYSPTDGIIAAASAAGVSHVRDAIAAYPDRLFLS
jgi:hypothetical protein